MPGQMRGRRSLKRAQPPRAKPLQVETAQMRDLVLNGLYGFGANVASFLPHQITPSASRDLAAAALPSLIR
jgi:hypothetical protein